MRGSLRVPTESRLSLPLSTAKVYAESVPDDVGGQPFQDGEGPEFHHGAADEEFAALVLDEAFVRSAAIHEPTAVERILAAAQSHAESETARGFEDGHVYRPGSEGEFGPDDEGDGPSGPEDLDELGDVEELGDDEGRFDRSDYTEYLEPGDGGGYDHHESPGPFESYGPYNVNSFGDSGHYTPYPYGRFAQFDDLNQFNQFNQFSRFNQFSQHDPYGQYGQYIRFGGNRRYDPRFDVGEEHGSDHRPRDRSRPAHAKHGAAPRRRPRRGPARWQRLIAWLLALVMGVGMVALALCAVYRGTSQQRQEPTPPPATTGVDSSGKGRDGAQRMPGVPAQPGPG